MQAQKVDVQVEDEEGETALSTARDATNLECVEMLLQVLFDALYLWAASADRPAIDWAFTANGRR